MTSDEHPVHHAPGMAAAAASRRGLGRLLARRPALTRLYAEAPECCAFAPFGSAVRA